MPDSTLATLQQIITKVRRLTRSPSTNQLADQDIENYINTFVLYDMPSHLRLFALHSTFTFYTTPNVADYDTNTTDPNNPLYNFNNQYISIQPPIYVAGFQQAFTQSRNQFFGTYSILSSIQSIGVTGDGTTTIFSGALAGYPVLQNYVQFTSVDANNNGILLADDPTSSEFGNLIDPNDATVYGLINYLTGEYNFFFPVAPAAGAQINSQTVPYQPSLPQIVLYYDDVFTFRPVPDQVYQVTMDVYVRPTELLATTQQPQLAQWWQYIAYGAAKKVFEDRMDVDSVALILPEFKKQEVLVLRTTIVQNTNERAPSIYAQQTDMSANGTGGAGGGSGSFGVY
jgi:hypothetical protein